MRMCHEDGIQGCTKCGILAAGIPAKHKSSSQSLAGPGGFAGFIAVPEGILAAIFGPYGVEYYLA